MKSGFTIGFAVGCLFVLLTRRLASSVGLRFHFKFQDRLVNVQEADLMVAEGAKVVLIEGHLLFRTILLAPGSIDPRDIRAYNIIPQAMMMNKLFSSKRWLFSKICG